MRIQQTNQNFGAIRIMPKMPARKFASLIDEQNESDLRLIDPPALRSIYELLNKHAPDIELTLGKLEGKSGWNIMSKKGSEQEKSLLQKLTDMFSQKNIDFEAKSMPDESANESIQNHERTMNDLYINYLHKNNPNT
jgi:hypothetical protein